MPTSRQLHLFAFLRPVAIHTGGWRYPGAYPDANFNFAHLKRFAQRLEAARFDAVFMADHLALLNMPLEALKRSHTVTSFEPFTLLSALAAVTERIGLVATASTTFDAPFHIARRFASLDHLSGGRAGWNIVTTANPDAALNFGLAQHMPHAERYDRAREVFDVVTGLWDSFADDAFVRDQETGIYFDPEKLHVLDHKGPHLSVRGPLNIARPVQGWPVIVQAGASDDGRRFAAETAEVVFAAHDTLAAGPGVLRRRERPRRARRPRSRCHQDPARRPRRGRRQRRRGAREARAARQPGARRQRDRRAVGRAGVRCERHSIPTRRCPEIPESNASKGNRAFAIALARREGLTVRQLAQRLGGYAGLAFVGTPRSIADEMEAWLDARGCDGFNVMFPYLPAGLDDVVDKVIPELQRRGLFRREYPGTTLRETLGLARPGTGSSRVEPAIRRAHY